TESERVRDPGDLEDALVAEPPVACADGRLGDAEVGGDPAERLAAVPLERLDDPPVHPVELGRAKDGPASCLTPATRSRRACLSRRPGLRLAAQCEAFLPNRCASGKPTFADGGMPRASGELHADMLDPRVLLHRVERHVLA